MSFRLSSRFQLTPIVRATVLGFSALICLSAAQAQAARAPQATVVQVETAHGLVKLTGQEASNLQNTQRIAPLAPTTLVSAMITLPLRNTRQLDALITALQDPSSPLCGQYLTPQQFTQRFGPTQADYDAVVAFARAQGLHIISNNSRMFLDVQGTTPMMEAAFHVRLNTYRTTGQAAYQVADQTFFAADQSPSLPVAIAGKVLGVIGLNNSAPMPRKSILSAPVLGQSDSGFSPLVPGLTSATVAANALQPNDTVPAYSDVYNPSHGTGGYNNTAAFGPQDLRKAYGLEGVPATGKGQVVALFALGGYYTNDATQYKLQYHLPDTPIVFRSLDGFNGAPNQTTDTDSTEAALDMDMELALSPEAKEILIYDAYVANANDVHFAFVHALAAVAKDNVASQFSSSANGGSGSVAEAATVGQFLKQLAVQGITFFVSSGDGSTYEGDHLFIPDGNAYTVNVGGSALFTNPDGSYQQEWAWNDYSGHSAGGYTDDPIPSYQQTGILGPFDTTSNGGSSQYRNIPDVAANASISPGVAGYLTLGNTPGAAGWYNFAGTSAASPIWAGFLGTVNQVRAQAGLGRLGFANPALYSIGQLNTSATVPDTAGRLHPYPFAGAFHDVTFGDDNDHVPGDPIPYTAGPGYDNVTGNGSFDGEKMIGALCFISGPKYAPPAVPTKFTATPGSKSVKLTWTAAAGAKGYLIYRTPSVSPNPASIGYLTALTGTSYTDTAVTSGTVYQYKLMAVGSGGGIFAAPVAVTPGL